MKKIRNTFMLIMMGATFIVSPSVFSQQAPDPAVITAIKNYDAAWNEGNFETRLGFLQAAFADDFSYMAPNIVQWGITINTTQSFNGFMQGFHNAIAQAGLAAPVTMVTTEIEFYEYTPNGRSVFRYDWLQKTADGAVVLGAGTEFGTTNEQGKIDSLIGFFGDLTTACGAEKWHPRVAYTQGNQVAYLGKKWEARWWTRAVPGTEQGPYPAWEEKGECIEDLQLRLLGDRAN